VLVLVLVLEGMRAWVETAAVARRKKRLPSHDEAMMMVVVMQASLCFVGKEGVDGQPTEAKRTLRACQSQGWTLGVVLVQLAWRGRGHKGRIWE